jgi:uncharacterized membrane protein YeaQ/YmgE (transglycosylase-associated protein family)
MKDLLIEMIVGVAAASIGMALVTLITGQDLGIWANLVIGVPYAVLGELMLKAWRARP